MRPIDPAPRVGDTYYLRDGTITVRAVTRCSVTVEQHVPLVPALCQTLRLNARRWDNLRARCRTTPGLIRSHSNGPRPYRRETDMPYRDEDDMTRPYAWDSPEAAWDALVPGQSPDVFFSLAPASEYAATIEDELRDYVDFYRTPGEMLADMTDDERDKAVRLLARHALANLSDDTRAALGY